MLNIPSTVNDTNYRYRMHKMNLKIYSKGNGIKTNIVNLGDVAKSLRTDEQYILKFFGFYKASQTTFKYAGGKNNTNYIISGYFTSEYLLKVLDKYIDKYICCPKCKLPEMHMLVDNDKVCGKCDSCPFVGYLDNKHKLTAFILKNPPVAKSMASGKNVKETAQGKAPVVSAVKKESKLIETQQVEEEYFSANNMDFESEELARFIEHIKQFVKALLEEDFDIRSAKIVAKIKPIGLKKPLIAYVLFHTFFTINISNQVNYHAKLYLNQMKKYYLIYRRLVGANIELETMLNLQYLFLEMNKSKIQVFVKSLPTILKNVTDHHLFSEGFLSEWQKGAIKDIEKNFLYNAGRDVYFKKIAQSYLNYLFADESDDEYEEAPKQDNKTIEPQDQNGSEKSQNYSSGNYKDLSYYRKIADSNPNPPQPYPSPAEIVNELF